VAPRGNNLTNWDSIFQPDGSNKTLSEMNKEERLIHGHYEKALEKFKYHLKHDFIINKFVLKKGQQLFHANDKQFMNRDNYFFFNNVTGYTRPDTPWDLEP
jgi:hypothetical protein